MRPTFLTNVLLAVGLLVVFSNSSSAQMNYNNLLKTEQVASFEFLDCDREVVDSEPVSFYVNEPLVLDFRVLIHPDGSVNYVRPGKVAPEMREFLKAGVYALYQHQFEPLPKSESGQDHWVNVRMHIGGTIEQVNP